MTSFSCPPVKLAFSFAEPEGGASDKPPIVFCHGLGASKRHWDMFDIPKIVANATKRKVYALDARNQGDSEWSDVMNSDANVDDLLHFMDTNGIKAVTIVGGSMGGATAMRTALRAPDRVESIVVEDMPCSRMPQPILDMIALFSDLGPAALEQLPEGASEEDGQRAVFGAMLKLMPKEMDNVIKKESVDDNIYEFRRLQNGKLAFKCNMKAIGEAVKDPDQLIPEYRGTFNGPACFIYGSLSPFNVAGDEESIKKHFPNAELIPIENATHNVHGDCLEKFMKVLLDFLLK